MYITKILCKKCKSCSGNITTLLRHINSSKITPAGKIMASVFWEFEGLIREYYLQRGQTITGQNYAVKEKRRRQFKAGILLFQFNALATSCIICSSVVCEAGILWKPVILVILCLPPYFEPRSTALKKKDS